jgi:hypothetical protein
MIPKAILLVGIVVAALLCWHELVTMPHAMPIMD